MSASHASAQPIRGVIGLIAALVGSAAMGWAFVSGISAALDGSGSGATLWTVIFLVAAVLVLAALVLAIRQLVRRQSRVIAVITIIVAAAPLLTALVLFLLQLPGIGR